MGCGGLYGEGKEVVCASLGRVVDHTGLDSGREGGGEQMVVVCVEKEVSYRSRGDTARPVVKGWSQVSGGTKGREVAIRMEEPVRSRRVVEWSLVVWEVARLCLQLLVQGVEVMEALFTSDDSELELCRLFFLRLLLSSEPLSLSLQPKLFANKHVYKNYKMYVLMVAFSLWLGLSAAGERSLFFLFFLTFSSSALGLGVSELCKETPLSYSDNTRSQTDLSP